MVSAISLCLLALGLTAASSQLLSPEADSSEAPLSDRRTFKHGKPVKLLPLAKKHKKFAGFVPHVFGKTSYAEIPIVREPLKPLYKVHRYQGIEVKPLPSFSVTTPEPFIETHSAEPPSDIEPAFASDFSFPGPFHPSVLLYSVHDKPILSSLPSAHAFPSLPPPPPAKPIFQLIPVQPQPIFPSLPITAVPSIVSLARPAPIPASFPSSLSPPVFPAVPLKVQPSVLPPLPSPTPAPILSAAPIKISAPVLPPLPASPSPPPPPPVFSTVSITPAPITHVFPSLSPPVSAPSPLPVSSLSTLPPPAPTLSTISISGPPEANFPYPPSGVPIPSYIKDISLGDIEIKDSPLPTIETPKYQDVTPTIPEEDPHNFKHTTVIKTEDGLLQKFKGWKADKANAALSHLSHFVQKPFAHYSIPTPSSPPHKIPPPQPSLYPTLQLPAPTHPLPLAPAPVFFPSSAQFFPKYESYPPNNIESPPLLNSYGVPISRDTFAPPHASHDRLSSAASEEEPSVVPAPSVKKDQGSGQKPEVVQRPSAPLLPEFHPQSFQSQFQAQSTSHIQPIYVPEEEKTVKEEAIPSGDVQPEVEEYSASKESNPENSVSDGRGYHNHKE